MRSSAVSDGRGSGGPWWAMGCAWKKGNLRATDALARGASVSCVNSKFRGGGARLKVPV